MENWKYFLYNKANPPKGADGVNKFEEKYQRYAEKMIAALLTLLQKKDFSTITVSELCRTAGVQRSTFYAHYSDTTELLRDMTLRALDGFWQYWTLHASQPPKAAITRESLSIYFSCIQENAEKAQVLLRVSSPLFWDTIVDWLMERMEPLNEDPTHLLYLTSFYLSGVNRISRIWLENDCKESVETLCDIIFNPFNYA